MVCYIFFSLLSFFLLFLSHTIFSISFIIPPFHMFIFHILCTVGAIEFGIVFVPALEEDQQQNDLEVETVEDMGRIRSDLQTIVGSFSPPSEGVVFFLWDNTYVLTCTCML